MNITAIRKLRQKLAAQQPVYGLWVTLESATITEMAVALGLDWVVIDAEHGVTAVVIGIVVHNYHDSHRRAVYLNRVEIGIRAADRAGHDGC